MKFFEGKTFNLDQIYQDVYTTVEDAELIFLLRQESPFGVSFFGTMIDFLVNQKLADLEDLRWVLEFVSDLKWEGISGEIQQAIVSLDQFENELARLVVQAGNIQRKDELADQRRRKQVMKIVTERRNK